MGVALVGESVAGGSFVPTSIAAALPDTITEKPGPGMYLVAKRRSMAHNLKNERIRLPNRSAISCSDILLS